jgi:hypothetical protein
LVDRACIIVAAADYPWRWPTVRLDRIAAVTFQEERYPASAETLRRRWPIGHFS